MKRCRRCGGEKSSFSRTCPWCGRGSLLATTVQWTAVAVVVLGAAVGTGLLPWHRLKELLPLIPSEPPVAATGVASRLDEPGGGMVGGAPRPMSGARAASPTRSEAADRVNRVMMSIGAAGGCADSGRVASLVRQYGHWSDRELALTACGRIQRGFTADQVRAALGTPAETEQAPDGAAGREEWRYRGLRVLLERGRVVSFGE